MRLTLTQAIAIVFAVAVALASIGAVVAANVIERRTTFEIVRVLGLEGYGWVHVTPDGLQVHLAGIAPSESARFRALTLAGQIIDSKRLIDEIGVAPSQAITAPKFSIELLRKPSGLSAIGLIPALQDRADLLTDLDKAAGGAQLTDLIETADYPIPEGWSDAVAYGLTIVAELPRAKVSITPGLVIVEAISDSDRQRQNWETRLREDTPDGVSIVLNIAAPRPAITPFVLRLVLDKDGARFDACSAATPVDRTRILAAAREAGAKGALECVIGLGAPSDGWADAAVMAINSLGKIAAGSVTFTNADVSFVGAADIDPAQFDDEAAKLARNLPAPYSMYATIQPALRGSTEETDINLPEFQVIHSPEGHVRVTGPLPDPLSRQAVETYLQSRFGIERISNRITDAQALPEGWPVRVLTGIEALSILNHGVVTIQPDFIALNGATGDADARAQITQLFGSKLGAGQNYSIDVDYLETLDPEANLPTAQDCVDRVNTILSQEKITFAPSSVTLEGGSVRVVNRIAEAMQDCQGVPMEIGGHTDSQGREEMNQQLSQSRAEAVLNALLARRILTTNLSARGYGEAEPIADNDTDEGREANRRIEFKLLLPELPEPEASVDPDAQDAADNTPTLAAPDETVEVKAVAGDTATATEESGDTGAGNAQAEPTIEATPAAQNPDAPGADAVLVARPTAEPSETEPKAETQDGQN